MGLYSLSLRILGSSQFLNTFLTNIPSTTEAHLKKIVALAYYMCYICLKILSYLVMTSRASSKIYKKSETSHYLFFFYKFFISFLLNRFLAYQTRKRLAWSDDYLLFSLYWERIFNKRHTLLNKIKSRKHLKTKDITYPIWVSQSMILSCKNAWTTIYKIYWRQSLYNL